VKSRQVVRVAAEEGDIELRGKNQANIRVLLVSIKSVAAALIKSHDIVTELVPVGRRLLNFRHLRTLGRVGVGVGRAWLHSRQHFGGHVANVNQHVQLKIGGFQLLGLGFGKEADLVIVFLLGGELLKRVCPDVVVGHDQAVGRDERPGAAVVEPHRRAAQLLDPGLGRLKAIFILKLLQRQVVKNPHAFIGFNHAANSCDKARQKGEFQYQSFHF